MKKPCGQFFALQDGAVLPIVLVSLVVLLGMVGLALDGAHAVINKTRVQNALDAAALSGAKTLDLFHNKVQAETDAKGTFTQNLTGIGNKEMDDALDASDVIVEFSDILFNPAVATDPKYVRVRVENFDLGTWFVHVLPGIGNIITVRASAVAGPSPILEEICNVVPILVCGDPSQPNNNYGYDPSGEEVTILKIGANNSEIGVGNFHLIQLDCGNASADCVRTNMAGDFNSCLNLSDPQTTKPGNAVAVATGLNTRIGICSPPFNNSECDNDFKPDLVTDAGALGYDDLKADYIADYTNLNFDHPDGKAERRVLAIPIGDCASGGADPGGGIENVDILSVGCFLMDRPADYGPNTKDFCGETNKREMCGKFMEVCPVTGVPGPDPGAGPGPYTIQLYKDPDAKDA